MPLSVWFQQVMPGDLRWIAEQDRMVTESQKPEELPVDLSALLRGVRRGLPDRRRRGDPHPVPGATG
jgi:hypothetical protein